MRLRLESAAAYRLSSRVQGELDRRRRDHHLIVPVPPGRSPLEVAPAEGRTAAVVSPGPLFDAHHKSTAVMALGNAREWLEAAGYDVSGTDGPDGGHLTVWRPQGGRRVVAWRS